jgi:hypothetical protein
MITEFPLFGKPTLEDKEFFDEFNARFSPYADWAFGTLMTWWDAFDDLEVARLGNNIVIKSSYLSMGKAARLVVLGNDNIDDAIEILFSYQKESGLEPALYSFPQYTIDAVRHAERYVIIEDPNASEYVLSAKMHATLDGPRMSALRKKMTQFQRSTEGHKVEVARMTLDNLPAKMLLINSLHTWHDIYKNDNERLEGKVIDTALLIAERIGLECLGLFIDKELHGFALYKYLSNKSINVNHIKVLFDYQNIFNYITHIVASHAYAGGVEHMNFEQDLGIEGLRTYKTRLRPTHMLHKYNVYPK